MMQPKFNDIFKDVNSLLNNDFYHQLPIQLEFNTVTQNNINFKINSKQVLSNVVPTSKVVQNSGNGVIEKQDNLVTPIPNSSLQTTMESKIVDSKNGLVWTQNWCNENNKLLTKLQINDLTPGLTTELSTFFNYKSNKIFPNTIIGNINFQQKNYFNSNGIFTLNNNGITNFVGDFTTNYFGIVLGSQFGYNINKGSINDYSVAMAYKAVDYSVGVLLNNKNLTSLYFNQLIKPNLEIGSKAVLNKDFLNNSTFGNNFEFVTKYLPDPNSQMKFKVSNVGLVSLSYKQMLRPGITLGIGTSFNGLNLNNQSVEKFGWSLMFNF